MGIVCQPLLLKYKSIVIDADTIRIKFKIFPTPYILRIKKKSVDKEYIRPLLEFVKIIEKERKKQIKAIIKNEILTRAFEGSIKNIIKVRTSQEKTVRISVGRKFFLF